MSGLLFLAHRLPFPPDRGDKIRSFHILRHLAARMPVHLVAFADDPADRDPPADFRAMLASCTVVPRRTHRGMVALTALLTGRPASLVAFADPRLRAAVDRVVAEHRIRHAYVFSGQMAQYLPGGDIRAVMDFVDVDSAKFVGYAARARGAMRWLMAREARLLAAYERSVPACVDVSLFVSAAEADLFRTGGGTGRIAVVENGIDANRYDPAIPLPPVAGEGPLIVFTGQMDYPPNVEAVTEFARSVLPRVRARHPAARFAIVGRAPTAAVRGEIIYLYLTF